MALLPIAVTITAVATQTFTFPTPVADYGVAASLTTSDGSIVAMAFAPFSSSMGTTTGTINFSDTITGTVNVLIYDAP